jgi:hypothetical protein
MPSRAAFAPWLSGAVLGAIVGTAFLGIGGRAAMRGIAMAQGAAPGFSLGGSLTVVFLGAAAGVAAGLIYVASVKLARNHMWWARLLFALAVLAITLRGLRPLDALRLAIFLPLFVAYGVVFDRLWARRSSSAPVQSETLHAA